MCTLVFGIDVPVPGSILIGANRDEDPGRPSDPPGVLNRRPPVIGGRDRVAGGTWLAIREGRAAVAMLNRRGPPPPPGAGIRSRGLLALDVAASDGAGALETARAALRRDAYAAFSLAFLAPGDCWILVHDPAAGDAVVRPGPGWHVLTHADLDDPGEPRTAALLASLRDWRPAGWDGARAGLVERLAFHGADPGRAVCIHDGPMQTVSSAIVQLGERGPRYLHAEGRPCTHPFRDLSALLEGTPPGRPGNA